MSNILIDQYRFTSGGGGGGIALVNTLTQGSSNGNGFTTSNVNISGANFIVLSISYLDFGTAATVSDSSSNTWNGLTIRSSGSDRSRLYYAYNATCTSTHNFTVTGSGTYASIAVLAFSGVRSASTPFDAESGAVTGSGNNTSQPGSITPASANSLFVTGLKEAKEFPTVSAPFSTVYGTTDDGSNHSGAFIAYEIQTTATARNPTWSWTSTTNPFSMAAVFKAP